MKQKKNIQNLLFPQGVSYQRQIDVYRTKEVNSFITLTHSLTAAFDRKEKGQQEKNSMPSGLVVPVGIEPTS